MPQQAADFDVLNGKFASIMAKAAPSVSVQDFCHLEGLSAQIGPMLEQLDRLDHALCAYLDSKRSQFARLYFTSNEELIELLGQMRGEDFLKHFIGKLFEGVRGLLFADGGASRPGLEGARLTGIEGAAGEQVRLLEPVEISPQPEVWLKKFEHAVKRALYLLTQSTVMDHYAKISGESTVGGLPWISQWPGQSVIATLQITFAHKIEEVFRAAKKQEGKPEKEDTLAGLKAAILKEIQELAELVRQKIEDKSRQTIYNMIINRVHARDSITQMLQDSVQEAEDFYWCIAVKHRYIKRPPRPNQTRSGTQGNRGPTASARTAKQRGRQIAGLPDPWDDDSALSEPWLTPDLTQDGHYELSIACINARLSYCYEYVGDAQRLVITPLTDRCFRTLFTAINYGYGAAPEGPAGTGKTETTKELAKSIGKMSFVFNCSSTLSYDAMLKFFKGFASGGGWSCFDEFNRIEPSALAAISQIILTVNQARRDKRTTIQLDGGDALPFNSACCVFITMNPFSMGRSKLPDNLKAQFRSVQMILPDLRVITEVVLYCNGFQNSRELSAKITKVFQFAKMQLGGSTHYDFGLRALKAVVEQAGSLRLLVSGCVDQEEQDHKKAKAGMEEYLEELKAKGGSRRRGRTRVVAGAKGEAMAEEGVRVHEIVKQESGADEREAGESAEERKLW